MTYAEALQQLKSYWIGKKVAYEGEVYKVVDVDSNFGLLIDKKARFTDTTAVGTWMVKEVKS